MVGRATAELFAENGYEVVVWGQNEERLAEVGQIEGIVAADRVNVRDDDEVRDAMSRTFDGRPLGVLVQSAGAIGLHSFAKGAEDDVMTDWEQMCEANLTSVVRVALAARDHLLQPGGSIVNISSKAASDAVGPSWAYATAKAGVNGFTRALAWELGPRGITVNAIAPGLTVPTGLTGWIDKKAQQEAAEKTPIRRNATPEDIAAVALHLANARVTTGQIIHVNSGDYLPG